MTDQSEDRKDGDAHRDAVAGLRDAFRRGYTDLAVENEKLRRQIDRQSLSIASYVVRERSHRRLIEDQHHLLAAARDGGAGEGELLRISVRDAMDLPPPPVAAVRRTVPAADTGAAPKRGLWDWIRGGARTRQIEAAESAGPAETPAVQRAQAIFDQVRRPTGMGYRPSPGLAAYTLPRGELRTIAFNLIETADERLEELAEEIAQAVVLNRRFAPLIVTTTRSELGVFRRRRLTYETLPAFGDDIARLTGIDDPTAYYDLRFRYLLRKWRAISVVNLTTAYVFGKAQPAARPGS